MNVDTAKRLVSLTRQASSYRAMARKGDLTDGEADLLISAINAEIVAIRSQGELGVAGANAPASAVQAGASPEGRSKK